MFFVLLLFIKSPSTDPNVLWFCFNCSKRRNIFRQNFFKIGNSGPNIACDRICNQLSYIPPIAICLTARKANGHRILRPWTNARCEFLKRPKPLMTYIMGAIHSTKLSGNFGPKLNGSVRSNRKSFEKTGPPFEVVLFSRSDRLEFWLNGSRPCSHDHSWKHPIWLAHMQSIKKVKLQRPLWSVLDVLSRGLR